MSRTKSPLLPWAIAFGAFLIGSWVGGLPLRSTIRQLRADLDDPKVTECRDDGVGREFASVFQGRPWEAGIGSPSPFEMDDEEAPLIEVLDTPPDDDDGTNWEFNFDGLDEDAEPQDVEEAMEMAREAMDIRKAQAWAALEDQAGLDEDQMLTFQDAIDRMNEDLMRSAEDLVATVTSGEEPTRREALMFADNVLSSIIETDDALYEILDADQRSAVEEEVLDPLAYVEPDLVDKLMELEQ